MTATNENDPGAEEATSPAPSPKVLQRIDRGAGADAVAAVRSLGSIPSLLAACVLASGGSLDLTYEQMGEAHLVDVEVVVNDRGGVTVRVRGAGEGDGA